MSEESWSEIPSSIWASMNSWFTPAVFFVLLNLMIGTIALTSIFANKKQNQSRSSPSVVLLQRLKSMNFYSHQDPQISSIDKQTPDSDTHVSVERTHNLETQERYFFQENMSVRDPQSSSNDKETPDSDTLFGPVHSSQNLDTDVHYFSQENHQILQLQAPNSIFERTHEQNPEKLQAHFVFVRKDSDLDDFEQAQEEKVGGKEPEDRSVDEVYRGGGFSRTKSETEPSSGEAPVKLPAKMRKSASLKSAFGHFEEEKIVEARRPATVREKARVTEGDQEVDAKADDFIHKFKQQLKLQRLDSIIRYKDMIGRGS
ncbi:hypothetical protein OROGR_010824 [Orobanche gracilis]